ncbi:rRNA-processing protein utp21 [Recurvomyces mirabilis]|uniref:rRNA-processing protein utp21 n=1 Tax=Recurvomyces mirabilis TaxID=574656 RepID=A0AAE0WJQ5_9PEZI|nr:rRNA-processing protein utp21 [Recurvomyces mirabilis]KAK5150936.1 rRNA-processing protein utp21 [Recurvomyces mirabilis]
MRNMEVARMDEPVAKRQKLANGDAKGQRKPGSSRLFAPYRTIGLVSPTSVPFTSVPLGKTTFQITTCVGRSLQTYDLRKGLNLVFITRPQTPGQITASIAWKDKVFGAWSEAGEDGARGAWVFKRGKKIADLEVPKGWRQDIKAFCCFGGWMVGVCDTTLLIWKTATNELYTTLQGVSPVHFTKCISSLPTFLNKVVVGREDGSAEVWNVSSGKLVYTVLPPSTSFGAVTAIEPTPALSLVAVAYQQGPLLIHDVRADQTVMQLNMSAGVAITSITFRTDGIGAGEDGQKPGVMATASSLSGDVTLWDLNEGGRKAGVLRSAHADPTPTTAGGISKIEFLPGQHTLVSSGLDNNLKTWIFDQMPFSPIPRILHHRGGHGAPITNLEFLPTSSDGADDTGKWLMSASQDRSLWGWSLRRDNQSQELSQGALQSKARKQGLLSGQSRDKLQELKCPPITGMACSLNRDGGMGAVPGNHGIWQNAKSGKKVDAEISGMTGWESVITAHQGDHKARTWFWGRKRAGRWAFPTSDESPVTSVAVDPSGTFAVVGSQKGGIDMFNLQSGIHRQRFPARLAPMQAKQLRIDLQKTGFEEERTEDGKKIFYRGQGKHGAAVVGLAVNNLNKTLVSAGEDGKVKFWDFNSGLLVHQLDWTASTGISSMRFHRAADLAAFACTDGCVRVVDISTHKLIRELWPSRPSLAELQSLTISDLTFSPDGHWIAASLSSIILLWDLPTGHLIDAFKLQTTCVSLAFSPTGEYLATAREGSVGVDVWSNKALFMHVPTRLIGKAELETIVQAQESQAPTASGEGGKALITLDNEDEETTEDEPLDLDLDAEPDIDQLSSDLLSLSMVPRSRWQNLLHLDLIRVRNKPTEAPKKPEKAPFFLPSLQDRQAAPGAATSSKDPRKTTGGAELEQERSQVLTQQHRQNGSREGLSDLLRSAAETGQYTEVIEHLKALPPAAADIALRSLFPSPSSGEMVTFVHALTWLLRERRDFELGQVWMARFLGVHGDIVVSGDAAGGDNDGDDGGEEEWGLRKAVEVWRGVCEGERKRVGRLVGYCAGVVGWVGRGRV